MAGEAELQENGTHIEITKEELHENKKRIKKEDLLGFFILVVLYTIQGIPMGFFGRTIHVLFIENGAHVSDLGTLSLSQMPYALKFLVAPIMDTHYFKSLGKRKSYIIPMQYVFCILCFMVSSYIVDEIKNLNVLPVCVFGLAMNTIMAIQDVAVDGWALSIVSPENLAYGSLAQSIGLTLGGILAFNVFIPLNSVSFCNSYIYSAPREAPLLELRGFWFWTGAASLIITVLVHFFKNEKPTEDEITSAWEVTKTLKVFVQNPNLRQLVLVTVTAYVTTAPIFALADTKLIQKGFHKEAITNITTTLMPLQFIVPVFVSRLCKKKLEMKVKLWAYTLSYFNYIFLFWIVVRFNKDTNYDETLAYFFLAYIFSLVISCSHFVANGSYSNRICDESIGGTFLTTLAALGNLSFLWPRSICLYVNEYISWEAMATYTVIATPFYWLWYRKQMNSLHTKTAEDFKIKSTKSE